MREYIAVMWTLKVMYTSIMTVPCNQEKKGKVH